MKTLADIFGVKIEKDTVQKKPMRVEDIDCSSRLEKYFKEYNSKVKHGNNKMREQFEKLPEIARNGKPRIVYGFGISDELTSVNGVHLPAYRIWKGMMRRCYSEKYQETAKTYANCEVGEEFRYYSKFRDWCHKQEGFGKDGFELDKDLIKKGNRIYSPNLCCFLPREINSALIKQENRRGELPIGVSVHNKTGLYVARLNEKCKDVKLGYFKTAEDAFYCYKNAKEVYVRSLANKWKYQISHEAYLALTTYSVDILD